MGRPLSAGAFVLGHLGARRPLIQRARTGIAFLGDGRRAVQDMVENHWVATNELAAGLELGDEVRDSLLSDLRALGRQGRPAEAKGAQIRVAARLVNLADVVEVFHRAGGLEAAMAVARERSGTQFDPELVDPVLRRGPGAVRRARRATSWDAVIAAEPALGSRPLRRATRRLAGGDRRFRRPQVAVDDRPFARRGRPWRPRRRAVMGCLTTTSSSCDAPAWCTTSGGSGCPTRSGTSAGR